MPQSIPNLQLPPQPQYRFFRLLAEDLHERQGPPLLEPEVSVSPAYPRNHLYRHSSRNSSLEFRTDALGARESPPAHGPPHRQPSGSAGPSMRLGPAPGPSPQNNEPLSLDPGSRSVSVRRKPPPVPECPHRHQGLAPQAAPQAAPRASPYPRTSEVHSQARYLDPAAHPVQLPVPSHLYASLRPVSESAHPDDSTSSAAAPVSPLRQSSLRAASTPHTLSSRSASSPNMSARSGSATAVGSRPASASGASSVSLRYAPLSRVSSASAAASRSYTTLASARNLSSVLLYQQQMTRNFLVSSQRTLTTRRPLVYAALLSRVAAAFRDLIETGTRTKNGLEYNHAFTGREAVDVIAFILRSSDRNLALLLGRALDAQGFFRDVTYEHRLRDSRAEVYLFVEPLEMDRALVLDGNGEPEYNFMAGILRQASMSSVVGESQRRALSRQVSLASMVGGRDQRLNQLPYPVEETYPSYPATAGSVSLVKAYHSSLVDVASQAELLGQGEARPADGAGAVNGVFTLLSACYSPTCTRDRLCYSIACPRRLEQQARLNLTPAGGLRRSDLRVSLNGDNSQRKELWSYSVPQSVRESVTKEEQKRQEVIFEIMSNERDFIRDMEYLRDFWLIPLRTTTIIPEKERDRFIRVVFAGIVDILASNFKFAEALTKRQKKLYIVEEIGDIMVEFIPRFEVFLPCCAGQVFSKYEFERQTSINPLFGKFVRETQSLEASRNHEFISFLSRAFNRPGRYFLLLQTLEKTTPEDSKDYANVTRALKMMQSLCTRINTEAGILHDRFNISLLRHKFRDQVDDSLAELRLRSEDRTIIQQISLKRRTQDKDVRDIQVYLLDNAVLFMKHKLVNKKEVNKVFNRPIPLPLLYCSGYEDDRPSDRFLVAAAGASGFITANTSMPKYESKYPVTFMLLGRRGFSFTLYNPLASTEWLIKNIHDQQVALAAKHDVFVVSEVCLGFFGVNGRAKLNCAVPCDGGTKLLFGTDEGIYVSQVREISKTSRERVVSNPIKIIDRASVTQLHVLVEYLQIVALCDKRIVLFSLAVLKSLDLVKNTRGGRELMAQCAFFRSDVCNGSLLICGVKTGLSPSMRVFETPPAARPFSRHRDYPLASEPLSVSFLRKQLIVGCVDGFEILSLGSSLRESLLDEADTSLMRVFDKGAKKELRPLSVHRIQNEFLLNYSEFSFYINKNGWKSKGDWNVRWEGEPQAFALEYPYLIAFEPSFIEVRHCETGELLRAVVGENIRFLNYSYQEVLYVSERDGGDVVSRLDLGARSHRKR